YLLSSQRNRSEFWHIAFSPDGQRLAAASWDQSAGTIKVWDAATGTESLTIRAHPKPVTSVAFSPDGKRLASAGGEKSFKVWDATTGQELFSAPGHVSWTIC